MPASGNVKKGTKQFMRQGHTAANYQGSDPNQQAVGKANDAPREIRP